MYLCAKFKLCAFKTPPSAIPKTLSVRRGWGRSIKFADARKSRPLCASPGGGEPARKCLPLVASHCARRWTKGIPKNRWQKFRIWIRKKRPPPADVSRIKKWKNQKKQARTDNNVQPTTCQEGASRRKKSVCKSGEKSLNWGSVSAGCGCTGRYAAAKKRQHWTLIGTYHKLTLIK